MKYMWLFYSNDREVPEDCIVIKNYNGSINVGYPEDSKMYKWIKRVTESNGLKAPPLHSLADVENLKNNYYIQ